MKMGLRRWLVWFGILVGLGGSLLGCKKKQDPPDQRPTQRRPEPRRLSLEDHLQSAIKRVKAARNVNGFPIGVTLQHLRARAVAIAKSKQLPPPSPFEWRGACSDPQTCKVMVEFWDGKDRMVAQWLVSGKKIEPIDTLAQGLMNPKLFAPKTPAVRRSTKVVKQIKKRRKSRRRRRYRRRRRKRRRRYRKRRRKNKREGDSQ